MNQNNFIVSSRIILKRRLQYFIYIGGENLHIKGFQFLNGLFTRQLKKYQTFKYLTSAAVDSTLL